MTLPKELPTLYTSFWANGALAELDVVAVGVSRGTPRFRVPYRYQLLRALAPAREVFCIEEPDEFTAAYLAYLDTLGIRCITTDLVRISEQHGGRPLALLCFETRQKFCHRHLLAGFIEERTGQVVRELDSGVHVEPHVPLQGMLFE